MLKLKTLCVSVWFAEISLQGEKYLDEQIENAINGVKEMKSVMQKSSEDHKKFVDALEKTKQKKEVAAWWMRQQWNHWAVDLCHCRRKNKTCMVIMSPLKCTRRWWFYMLWRRKRCVLLRRWKPSWQRRRKSVTRPCRLSGRSVSPAWRTPASNTTPGPAAADRDWWDARSDMEHRTELSRVIIYSWRSCRDYIWCLKMIWFCSWLPAAWRCAEQNIPLLHLDQRREDRHVGAGGAAAEQRVQEPGGQIYWDGRRSGQHLLRQHEGTDDEGTVVRTTGPSKKSAWMTVLWEEKGSFSTQIKIFSSSGPWSSESQLCCFTASSIQNTWKHTHILIAVCIQTGENTHSPSAVCGIFRWLITSTSTPPRCFSTISSGHAPVAAEASTLCSTNLSTTSRVCSPPWWEWAGTSSAPWTPWWTWATLLQMRVPLFFSFFLYCSLIINHCSFWPTFCCYFTFIPLYKKLVCFKYSYIWGPSRCRFYVPEHQTSFHESQQFVSLYPCAHYQ